MIVNIPLLREKIKKANLTQEAVAKGIFVDKSTFSRKMQSHGETFTIGEMHKIVDVLCLSKEDAVKIFLS